jgi:methyl-accepting chemotaxis protein
MRFSDWRIGARIGAGFALLIATLMLVLGFTLASFGRQNEADARNRESARAQEAAQALLLAVVNMETGLRGFVASGKESFLDAYEEGRSAFAPQLSALDAASAGRPEQQQRVAGMRAARAGFGTVAESLIKKRRDATELMSGTDELVAAFSQGDDKKATDEFRRLVAA